MTQNDDFVIETHRLSKSFGDVRALQNIDLNVPIHSIFGFLGPNGAGKTTLMKTLLGLSRPPYGNATISGLTSCETVYPSASASVTCRSNHGSSII